MFSRIIMYTEKQCQNSERHDIYVIKLDEIKEILLLIFRRI